MTKMSKEDATVTEIESCPECGRRKLHKTFCSRATKNIGGTTLTQLAEHSLANNDKGARQCHILPTFRS
jgi:hypothetical protein